MLIIFNMLKVISIVSVVVSAEMELVAVQQTSRNGSRQPVNWEQDPWNYIDDWISQGELTGVGMRQHYELGKFMRKRYVDEFKILDPFYNPEQLYAQSSDKNRTIMSLQSQLMGLYPASNEFLTKEQ